MFKVNEELDVYDNFVRNVKMESMLRLVLVIAVAVVVLGVLFTLLNFIEAEILIIPCLIIAGVFSMNYHVTKEISQREDFVVKHQEDIFELTKEKLTLQPLGNIDGKDYYIKRKSSEKDSGKIVTTILFSTGIEDVSLVEGKNKIMTTVTDSEPFVEITKKRFKNKKLKRDFKGTLNKVKEKTTYDFNLPKGGEVNNYKIIEE